ncbi:hypothetical protein MPTK1_2g08600 [Marchantia polymorpha subsp. ruderalis]|uniref:Uncharacterized protein n=1 Tax=Marchantia polymorpha TaxID=3197 RepID=A0A2R6XGY5_MARPO|nr:hypothetical protein MARPO_0015s0145 [Marchantia polymorpha]BBN01584.1 hypothetical protein Mp_2g08600 [Marchantia polymorpha subsp. ruderalis]|eukprot:PTQ45351.1 hypothetical protein MARPO_0015s0145 [Marchantia polymorpha]
MTKDRHIMTRSNRKRSRKSKLLHKKDFSHIFFVECIISQQVLWTHGLQQTVVHLRRTTSTFSDHVRHTSDGFKI